MIHKIGRNCKMASQMSVNFFYALMILFRGGDTAYDTATWIVGCDISQYHSPL